MGVTFKCLSYSFKEALLERNNDNYVYTKNAPYSPKRWHYIFARITKLYGQATVLMVVMIS